jgi:hypothetical protein
MATESPTINKTMPSYPTGNRLSPDREPVDREAAQEKLRAARERGDTPPAERPPLTRPGANSYPGKPWRETRQERRSKEARQHKMQDDIKYYNATQGCSDPEVRDRVLALGGDATRSSPVGEQALPEPEPGLTTTTGAYRVPIDPTTAAVPADEYSDIVIRTKGTPTVGSGEAGVPEELWATEPVEPKHDDKGNEGDWVDWDNDKDNNEGVGEVAGTERPKPPSRVQ